MNEESINTALQKKEYQKVLNDVNTIAYPLFEMKDLDIKIKNNRVYFIMRYNFPISPSNKNKTFVVSTLFNVIDNKIKTCDIKINEAYGIIQTNKTANLLNRLMPLSYTMSIINKRNCNTKIETVKIIDDLIKIDGKIYIKGD